MNAAALIGALLEDGSNLIVSAVLTPQSRQRLLQRVPPVHPEVKAHHMTISFDPPTERIWNYYRSAVGKPMVLRVYGVAQDERGQAVRVEGESENPHPHITISCATGVPAKYSNELLAQGWEPLDPFTLEAVVEIEPVE
jgi:hypothetical protein